MYKSQIDLAKTRTSECEQINARVVDVLSQKSGSSLARFHCTRRMTPEQQRSLMQQQQQEEQQFGQEEKRHRNFQQGGKHGSGAGAAITDYATPTRSLSCCWLQCSIDADFPSELCLSLFIAVCMHVSLSPIRCNCFVCRRMRFPMCSFSLALVLH